MSDTNGNGKANGKTNGKAGADGVPKNGKGHRYNTQNLRPPWKPGQSGNPKGAPKGIRLTDLLRSTVEANDFEIGKALIRVAEKQALKGDHKFWTSIIERLDGKVPDRVAGHDGGPLVRYVGGVDMDLMTGKRMVHD